MGMNPQQPPYGEQPSYPQQPSYGEQPPYQQQPYPQQRYGTPPPPGGTGQWGPTSLGMEAHVAAGLSYLSMFILGPIIPIVFYFIEKSNRFVKFHAAQGILLSIAGVVLSVVWFILNIIFVASAAATSGTSNAAASAFGLGTCLTFCVIGVGSLALLAGIIWGAVAGFSGKATKLPVIGDIAERWAGGPVMPGY